MSNEDRKLLMHIARKNKPIIRIVCNSARSGERTTKTRLHAKHKRVVVKTVDGELIHHKDALLFWTNMA